MPSPTHTSRQETLARLDQGDPTERMAALQKLFLEDQRSNGSRPEQRQVNLHAHTIYSYNPYRYSPAKFAWLAYECGMAAAGIVDFDVLDGVDEFHQASAILNLRTVASIESRVFVPEFADKVINSPGEPGIAYHMGAGFVTSRVPEEARAFMQGMRGRAEQRTRTLVAKVNDYLTPLRLNYERDLLPLTPKGNATERHVCEAYTRKATQDLTGNVLWSFWTDKLGPLPADIDLPDGPKLQALLRAKTMKQGGAGYVQPEPASFPLMADMNRFTLQCGAIPTLAWLDGTSAGEQHMEELLLVARKSGAAALNIIPDRNFTPGKKDVKLQNLYDVVALAEKYGFPVIVGTEMNSPGNRFVDDFQAPELAPLADAFMHGADIVYGHTVLQRHGGLGYTSPWALEHFPDQHARNSFFARVGSHSKPDTEHRVTPLTDDLSPDTITDRLRKG